jgi:subtilisin family serine protease
MTPPLPPVEQEWSAPSHCGDPLWRVGRTLGLHPSLDVAMQPRSALLALLLLAPPALAQDLPRPEVMAGEQSRAPRFVERPGIVEFSGQMIVRPAQPAALADLGFAAADRDEIRARAAGRLRPHLVEYVSVTDEYIITLPPGRSENEYARELMGTGDYEYAEPNWFCFSTGTIPDDQSYSMQWHHPKVRSPLAWDTTIGDPSLVIAIVDSGVELDHPDLAGALVSGYNAEDRLAQSAGGDVSDVDGHGTFVAGLAGAIGNNGVHVTGMGWSFSIMPVRYYNSPGGGYLNNLLDGVRWAADHGARCINVSQTGVEYSSVQTTGAYVKSQGSLLLWAAGNDGRDLSWFDWDDVIIVGATDALDGKASFSASGLAVDVYAPGTDIISTGIPGGLALGSGTSASAPIAGGICALVWSNRPDLTPDQVEESLFAGCIDLGAPGNDSYWGWGRVDSPRSLGRAACRWYCGSATNLDTFVVSAPFVIGSRFQGTITYLAPNFGVVVAGYLGPLTFPMWGQEGLVNVGTAEVLGFPSDLFSNPAVVTWSVPHEPSYVGYHLYTQAAAIGGGAINLTCAYDCTVGY